MNYRRKAHITLIIILLLALALLNTSNSAANVNITPGDWLSYEVYTSSNTVNDFYGASFAYYGNWSVIVGDEINFNITSVQESVINGTLFLGNELQNTTFTDVRVIDTAFGLSIGIYPWNGGLIANSSDWDNIISSIQGTNTTFEEINQYIYSISGVRETYTVMHFNTVNYFEQNSSLYYHKESGVLLKGYTAFGLYELEILLGNTSLTISPYTEPESTNIYLFLSSLGLLSTALIIKKKRK